MATDAQRDAIRVAAPQTLCTRLVAPLVASCEEEGIAGRVCLLERSSAATEQSMLEGTADIGLLHGWPRSAVEAEAIARDAPVVLLPLGHPLASDAEVDGRALASHPLLLTQPGCRYRDYVEALLQEAVVRPRVRAEADSVSSLARLVAGGAGLAVLPRLAAEAAAAGLRVDMRPLRGAGAGLPICLVHAAGRQPGPAVTAFMGLLRAAAADLHEPVASLDVQHLARGVAVSK